MNIIDSDLISDFINAICDHSSQPECDAKTMAMRFAGVQNCCLRCKRYQKTCNDTISKIEVSFQPGAHPCSAVLKAMKEISALMKVRPRVKIEIGINKHHPWATPQLLKWHNDFLIGKLHQKSYNRNTNYFRELDGLYPCRLPDGTALKIKPFKVYECYFNSIGPYRCVQVNPFIESLSPWTRLKLYHRLQVKKLTAQDLPDFESALIGQWGVIARQHILKGTCIGVYSGTIVSEKFSKREDLFNHDYLYDNSIGDLQIYIDGDGIMSKINTCFDYDEIYEPYRQAKKGYNVVSVQFPARLENGAIYAVLGIFALKDMVPGEELRINYGYSKRIIKERFSRSYNTANP